MKYRTDVDGLRAIAVLPVLLFHAKFNLFSGGFIGVDVFFVISGYLITSLILSDLNASGFSIVSFYERRARRILPALFAVVTFSWVVAYQVCTPADLKDFGKSVVAVVTFSSNILFWLKSGYFDTAAEQAPLLHTWSLAVEEQFYILFPMLLAFVFHRARKRLATVIVAIALGSFGVSLWATHYHPSAAFYLAPTRAWELMLGAMIATGILPALSNGKLRCIIGLAGLVLIAFAIFNFSADSKFPGAAALIPSLGALFVIYAGEAGESWPARILGSPPLVFVGLISYSLYLWHWPLLLFARYYLARELTSGEAFGVLTLSAMAAIISWRFIERPFRVGSSLITRKVIFGSSGVTALCIGVVGVAIIMGDGYTLRFNFANARPVGRETYNERTCDLQPEQSATEYNANDCWFGSPNSKRAVLLWGDSHAAHWVRAVSLLAERHNLALVQANSSGCPPLLGYSSDNRPNCHDFNQLVKGLVDKETRFVGVILAANWSMYEREESYFADLSKSVAFVQAHDLPVLLVGQTPTFDTKVPVIYQQKKRDGEDATLAVSNNIADSKTNAFIVDGSINGVSTYFPHTQLCEGENCRIAMDESLLYWDREHLSAFGSEYLVGGFKAFFSSLNST